MRTRAQNHTREYFEMVVRSGGVEGKFVQDVYPYLYLVRDTGLAAAAGADGDPDGEGAGGGLIEAAPGERTVARTLRALGGIDAASATRLYAQWSVWWDTARPVLVEKTPENLLMGPFLQAAFGAPRTSFVFVMRHPLVWALAIEKWIQPEFGALRVAEERVAFWFECMERMASRIHELRDAVLLQLETASVSEEVQRAVARRVLCRPAAARAVPMPPDVGRTTAILSTSLAYATCWLAGAGYSTSLRRCSARRAFREPAFALHPELLAGENRERLRQLAARRELQANQFGYTFAPFERLASLPTGKLQRTRIASGAADATAAQLGVLTDRTLVRAALRDALVVPPPTTAGGASPAAAAAAAGATHVILVYHKLLAHADAEKPTGMDIRMGQVVDSLLALGVTVHFLCHTEIPPTQLSPFGAGVAVYGGTLQEQYSQAIAAAPIKVAFVFFTTLTMKVYRTYVEGGAWSDEPHDPLPEEKVVGWLRRAGGGGPCVVAVADDIHHLRVVEVMGRYDHAASVAASHWVRRRELAFHASVDSVITVSLEDAATLRGALLDAHSMHRANSEACGRCACTFEWVPFIHKITDASAVEPFAHRYNGMLYVGGMHGLAVIAVEWLVERVQPLLGASELTPGGVGHLYLAGPGWLQHMAESPTLNASVAAGRVTLLGTLSDLQLERRLQLHKAFVAPVFNGTGIATKNVMAMAQGIPLVTTTVGLHGLGLPTAQQAVLIADEPDAFASAVLRIHGSQELFASLWRAALAHTQAHLSAAHQQQVLCSLVRCPGGAAAVAAAAATGDAAGPPLCDGTPVGGGVPDDTTSPTTVATDPAAAERARLTAGTPLAILGLGGTGAGAVAEALRAPSGALCVVSAPLRGLEHASAAAQADHLRSILLEPAYCATLLAARRRDGYRRRRLADTAAAIRVQGFALELAPAGSRPRLLSTADGVAALAHLLTVAKARLLVVRRCDVEAWAALRLMRPGAPPPGAGWANGSLASSRALQAEVPRCRERDAALVTYVSLIGRPSVRVYAEALAAEPARKRLGASLRDLLGIEKGVKGLLWFSEKALSLGAEPLRGGCAAGAAVESQAEGSDYEKCVSAGSCRQSEAVRRLAQLPKARPPILILAAHGVEGGAQLLHRVVVEACRLLLTPRRGAACAFVEGFDGCDAESSDVCMLNDGRFSAARYVERGYRLVHLRRDPADVLARSYQLHEPNATHAKNLTLLQEGLEDEWRSLLAGTVYSMQAMADAHRADPRALLLRFEDLAAADTANATLDRLLGFALAPWGAGAAEQAARLRAAMAKPFGAALKAEENGWRVRKHLLGVVQRKPAKCHHVSKLQRTLGYPPVECAEKVGAVGIQNAKPRRKKGGPRQGLVRRRRRNR